jgi:hypothetical protein
VSTPITAIDHLHIATPHLSAAGGDYERLLGVPPAFEGEVQGQAAIVFAPGNANLLLTQDSQGTPGLREICFRVGDSARLERRLDRLAMDYVIAGTDPFAALRQSVDQHLVRLASSAARGLGISFIASEAGSLTRPSSAEDRSRVTGLDHVVIASSDAVKTAFLLGARLGLDLRMDRSNPAWGARLLFFRCGDLIVEVFQSLDDYGADGHLEDDRDTFYGLSWRVADADAARTMLHEAGVDVSAVRSGRKPGTRVFTVRDHTAGVATLMLEGAQRR